MEYTRATIYMDENIHKALKMRAAMLKTSISFLANNAIRESIEESEITRSVVVNSNKINPSQKKGDGSRAKKNRNSHNFQSKEYQV